MSDWNSGKLRVLIELLGAAAVLLGLMFVGYELRQNTAAVQSSTLQSMMDLSTNALIDFAMNPEFSLLINKAIEDPSQLDETESRRVGAMLRSQWLRYQGGFNQWVRGSLGDADWEIYGGLVCRGEDFGPIQEYYWPGLRRGLTQDFVAFVEGCRPDLAQVAD